MVPRGKIELNNMSHTGIIVSRLAFVISFLILSENGDLLLFNLFAALRTSFSVMEKSPERECYDHDVHFLATHCKFFGGLG